MVLVVAAWLPLGAGPVYGAPTVRAPDDHACIVGSSTPTIAWRDLRNPIMSYPSAGAKDQALVWFKGRWHMLFSELTNVASAPGGVLWNVASATSRDLSSWSAPHPWPHQSRAIMVASPDVVRAPSGRFVVTYQAAMAGKQAKLYYRTSRDLRTWSAPRPLAPGLAPRPDQRMIDAALAWTDRGLYLAYKSGSVEEQQAFQMAWSPSGSLGGPWRPLGPADVLVNAGTIEELRVADGSGPLAPGGNVEQSRPALVFHLGRQPVESRLLAPLDRCPPAVGTGRIVGPRCRHLEHRIRTSELGLPLRRPSCRRVLLPPIRR